MNAEMLLALRDQAGIPSHPLLFLVLGILTFALHLTAVHVMLGAGALTLRGALSADAHWRRLAHAMLTTSKISVSVAIVLGVAPLLFVQVIYDPFWYTSNVLSAWWVMAFIGVLIAGYLSMYVFYGRNHHLASERTRGTAWLVASLVLLLVVGWIVHSLTYQMLFPEQWRQWYAPNGVVDPSGQRLHLNHWPRFAFFIALSGPVIGAWLFGYRRYLMGRFDGQSEQAQAYGDFVARLAMQWLVRGGVLALALGGLWMATLPEKMTWFATSPWALLSLLVWVAVLAMPRWLGAKALHSAWGYGVFAAAAVAMIVTGVAREMLRYHTLVGSHGYNALDYRIQMDWYSTSLFFSTFAALGGVTLAYLLTVAWRAGQTEGTYTPGPLVDKLGKWSVGLLIVWTVAYFGAGILVGARA